jgi:hypothetical protein
MRAKTKAKTNTRPTTITRTNAKLEATEISESLLGQVGIKSGWPLNQYSIG